MPSSLTSRSGGSCGKMYDVMVSRARRDEAQVPWEKLKAEMGADEHPKD